MARNTSSLVIDSLYDQAKEEDRVVAWLYYDYLAQRELTLTNIMGAILKRLVGERIPRDIREAFQEAKKVGGRRPLLPDLMRMLKIAIASLPPIFICIDALDECRPQDLSQLLELLGDIVRESPTTRIFLTGRPHVNEVIRRQFVGAIVIPICPNRDDIRNYLEMRLNMDNEPEAMDRDLRADIMQIIMQKMSDRWVGAFGVSLYSLCISECLQESGFSFLLVSLSVEAILREITISERRIKLREIASGNGMSGAYMATLVRLNAQRGVKLVLGMKALMWVLYSERPLRDEELCHALGVVMGSSDMDPEAVPTIRLVLASCLGLLTLEASSSIVQIVHFTLREHLLGNILFLSPHSQITEVCLTYLNFRSVIDLSPAMDSAPSTMPFLEYASVCWGEHAKIEMTQNAKILALKLLHRFDKHISSQILLLFNRRYTGWSSLFSQVAGPRGFTGLHGVAFLGVTEMLTLVFDIGKWDVNTADRMGNSALVWAARRGQAEIVRVLLAQKDINPDQADREYGRTPLTWAAIMRCEGAVKMFLEREDVNPNQTDTEYGRTPLSWAAESGHKGIVLMLLERGDINPDHADTEHGRTALMWAIIAGREGVVKILLEREDVNPDYAHPECGVTPLLLAAVSGHGGIVKMLLERGDVNPDRADTKYGHTPLSRAAAWGHEGVVKMLLKRGDVNPNRAGTKDGLTPLEWAARNGHGGVVKILLEREDVRHGVAPVLPLRDEPNSDKDNNCDPAPHPPWWSRPLAELPLGLFRRPR